MSKKSHPEGALRKPPRDKKSGKNDARPEGASTRRGDTERTNSRRPNEETEPPDPEKAFRNFSFGPERRWVVCVLWISNLLVLSLLFVIAFAPPQMMSGGPAVLKTQDEFVGVLRKCSATTCDPWFGGDNAQSEGAFDYGAMHLTTGLATVTALWFAIFINMFNVYRTYRKLPPVEGGNAWDTAARYTYKAVRGLLVVNVILVPSLILDVVVKAASYRNAKSIAGFNIIGGGVALLFFAFLFTLLSTLIELRPPEGRTHRWILKTNFLESCGLGGGSPVRSTADVEQGSRRRED